MKSVLAGATRAVDLSAVTMHHPKIARALCWRFSSNVDAPQRIEPFGV